MMTKNVNYQSPLESTLEMLGDIPPRQLPETPRKKGPVPAETNVEKISEYLAAYEDFIDDASARYGVPRSWLAAVMIIESGGRPDAKSPTGCKGVMQLSRWIYGANQYGPTIDPYDPAQAIDRAGAFLGDLVQKYDGDLEKVMVGYNQGEGVLNRAIRGAKSSGGRWQEHLETSQKKEALVYIRIIHGILEGRDRRVRGEALAKLY